MPPDRVQFFLPISDRPPFARLPEPAEMSAYPALFLSPALNWTWRTHLHLRAAGYDCELVDRLPERGIVFSAACNLPLQYRPRPGQFIVSCVADSPPRFHPQFHVFQSATQAARFRRQDGSLPAVAAMPHWPQPGLLPREPAREDMFANIEYFGARDQLEPTLATPEFAEQLRAIGLNLRLNHDCYHDYRTTDAVLAVRRFGPATFAHKPASKLINAWRAGVPALLGGESAYRELRRDEHDFIEVNSTDAVIAACRRLANDPALRRRFREQATKRAADYRTEVITAQWIGLLDQQVRPAANRWQSWGRARRQWFFMRNASDRYGRALARRLRKWTGLPAT